MRQTLSSVACALVMAAGTPLAAQTAPASLPTSLISALHGDYNQGFSRYTVDTLPPGYPKKLIPPPPVRIVGGMTEGGQIVAVFADSTRRLAAVMEELFEQSGYVRPAPQPGSGFTSGGFNAPSSFFCGDSGSVSVVPLGGPIRTFVRVNYRRGRDYYCTMQSHPRATRQLTFPELKAPSGVVVMNSHGGGGDDEITSIAQISGKNLQLAAIVSHYAEQLKAAGWSGDSPAVSETVVAQAFHAKDPSGLQWDGVLVAAGSDSTELRISLNMHPRNER